MKRRIWVLVGVFLAGAFFFASPNFGAELKDNYYQAINADVIKANELEEGEYSWSYFIQAQEKVDTEVDLVVDGILDSDVKTLSEEQSRVIGNVYDKVLDMEQRDREGIGALKPYLDRVWKVSSVEELVKVIILVEDEFGVDLLSNVEVVQDYQNNDRNIIYFYPVTYAFGANSDYMVNEDYMTYKAYIRRACVQLWKAYGLEAKEAREVVDRVFEFYEGVSYASKLSEELGNITDYYNIVGEKDINDVFSNVGGEYLLRRGLGGKDSYSLVDKGQYEYLNDSLKRDNLEVWKEVIVTKILSSYADYLSSDYVEVVNNLNEAMLGSSEEKSNEEQAKELVKSLFSSEIDRAYEERYLSDECVKEVEEIFKEIKDVFAERLESNSWLSEEAKDKALVKLEEMELIVGLEETATYEVSSDLDVSGASLVRDIIKMQQLVMKNDLKRLDSGEKINLIGQTLVNAYYQPLDNSIVIPVAFFELVSDYDSYYEKLGTMGMIIAHEVTHAFDGNGSKFDENGNLNDWWSDDDKEVFSELERQVIAYYSQYEVLNGKYINGEKTVNENIADLGAVACIVGIAKDRNASDEEMRNMFSSFARIWSSVECNEYMEVLLLQDVHSPNKFRVNAVLSSIDEFYTVYNIYPWSKMWINKENRVRVW